MLKTVRWQLIALIFVAGIINYIDRAALSIAAPLVSKELALDPAQLGILFSSFFIGYSLFCFIGGYAADRFGPRRVMAIAMLLWSLFCGATALAFSFGSLLVLRVLFGMAEGPFNTTINKTISNWFPRREQGRASGLANAGTALGGAIAGPIVGLVALHFGWRASFIAIMMLGLIWVVAWMIMSKDQPFQHKRVTAQELHDITSDQEPENSATERGALTSYLRKPTILATAFAFFGYSYLLYFFLTWFPSYLINIQHLSVSQMSIVSMIPWSVGFVGMALGGFVSDFIFRKTGNLVFSRKIVLVVSLSIAAVAVAVAGMVTSVVPAVTAMTVAVFFMYLTASAYWTTILSVVEKRHVGSVSGFVHLVANLAGIAAPTITGILIQWTGVYQSAFLLAGAIAVSGALCVFIFVRKEVPSAVWTKALGEEHPVG
ncbi:MFS transporter [Phyllobacterium myrsinacearum]|uniref:MFS transporter n=1 Tax=Phyllobacterium myrsinacearum TaxID=28101 RepID=A0A2S9JQM5_9HYPH|nr:MFS transporter [Phyllobacterium myrsinacearum]PRD55538.1 MFS transporter [Phyllobacterium myrsinacearum]PWV91891.1 ACS family hexuronate transporter-like MFS transporter [Phyllobacterium myrsinacearum]RZS77271.1 ACS family hexuronate transporter-like MFS transporter [Phyllobacterium myrsinacearum]RZV05958.1 ACS family hexuronate transporter-like MFS transporter [Phyllobacterium myrsinacearum]